MNCPACGGKTTVIDNSLNHIDNEIYRKRKCINCKKVFYTSEFEVDADENFKKEWNRYYRSYKVKK